MDSRALAVLLLIPVACNPAGLRVEDVLNHYEAALGGREHLARITAMEIFGTVEGMGLSGTTYSVQAAPDRFMERVEIGPLSYSWAHTAQESWIQDQSGIVRSLSDAELEEFLLLAQVGGATPMSDELRARMRLSDSLSDATHLCVLVEHSGGPVELYFRRETWLLDKVKLTKLGMPVEARFSDFRSVEGVMLPFHGVQTIAGVFSLEMKVARVRVNDPVSAAVFQPPRTLAPPAEYCAVPVRVDGHLIAPVVVDGVHQLRFFVDSGAGMSCIDRAVAQRLGLASLGALPAQGVVGFDSVGVTTVGTLTIGCLTMDQARLAVVDLSLMNSAAAEPVHGILGYGLFAQRSIGRSGVADSLTLGSPDAAAGRGYAAVPLQFIANVPVVEAVVEGKRGRFIVDTGNSFALILHTPFAVREGLMPGGEDLALQPAAGIGGGAEVLVGEVDSLELAGTRLGPIPTLFSSAGRGVTGATEVAGNIGLPLLERFDWVLDYQGATLYIRPRHQP
ncbi:MAG: retroviral-like aspartic protease family protein [Candidatus Eisenbacteria bacterium]|jgi:predicted aspartyl protease|nr:retroviral-like aspartic protease family protein [Candidatus Eisenbacteria bacterium]